MARALVHLPPSPRRGEVFEIRTLIAHPMESGFRVDAEGRVRPRNLIRRFTCHFDGELVFSAELSPAIAGNPFVAFHFSAPHDGSLSLRWEGDQGFSQTEVVALRLS